MTKEIRDNFDGLTHDADESWEFTFINRNDPRGLIKVEGDLSESKFLELYGSMTKKPPYQVWHKAKKDSDGKTLEAGYWQKIK